MTTLKLKEKPQSCGECQLRGYNEALDYDDHEGYTGAICHGEKSLYMEVSDYLNADTRHPDCPLEITEDNLRWVIEYTKDAEDIGEQYHCPKCRYVDICDHNYCSNCGTKLLPPEEK